jgi:anti-sigma regulatory factor (Ser/Thr protein kinase)
MIKERVFLAAGEAAMNVPDYSRVDLPGALVAERCCLVIPSNLDWIEPTIEWLRRRSIQCGVCNETTSGKVVLALTEALVNAIIHGNLGLSSKLKEDNDAFAQELARRSADPELAARTVTIDIDYDGERCRWEITDQGMGFDHAAQLNRLEEPPTEEDLLRPSGRGLIMMRAFTDELRYDMGGRRVQLTLRKGPADQRHHMRMVTRQRAQVVPVRADGSVDWEAVQEALARDLSAGGIGLLQHGLANAERVLIGLAVEGRTVYLPAEVQRCSPVEGDMVELGCRFQLSRPRVPPETDTIAAAHALDDLLSRLYHSDLPGGERRGQSRIRYTERVTVQTSEGRQVTAFARDLSRSGIALITAVPLEPTPHAVFVLLPQRDGQPLSLPGRIVRCQPIAGGFHDVAAVFLIGP